MADIFLSYKREDQWIAREVAADLEVEGYSVFFDVRIEVGDSWDATIERELNAAKAVVVLWSPKSRDSKWVRREAREAGEKLCPAVVKPCKPPLEFSDVQAANLIGRRQGDLEHPDWRRLCDGVEKCVGRKPRSTAATSVGSINDPRKTTELKNVRPNPRMIAIGAGILAILVVGIFLALKPSTAPETSEAAVATTATTPQTTRSHEADARPTTEEYPQSENLPETHSFLLGTWRCTSSSNASPMFIRYTRQGRLMIYWYTDDANDWPNYRTAITYPVSATVWQSGAGGEWTMQDDRIVQFRDNAVYLGDDQSEYCYAYTRLAP